MSQVPTNIKGGTPRALLTYNLLQNIKKLERETLLSRIMPKKIEKKTFSLVRFFSYVKIVKNEREDPFALISADRTWPYGSSFSSFDCKKSGLIRVIL